LSAECLSGGVKCSGSDAEESGGAAAVCLVGKTHQTRGGWRNFDLTKAKAPFKHGNGIGGRSSDAGDLQKVVLTVTK